MVQVEEKLDVTAEDFFERIADSVLYDIKDSVGKEISREELCKGYRYVKDMKNKVGRSGKVDIEITEYQPPLRYSAKFHSAGGTNRIEYEIEKLEEGRIQVRYTEDYDGNSKSQEWNYRIIGALYKRKAKKRMADMLHGIEAYIKKGA